VLGRRGDLLAHFPFVRRADDHARARPSVPPAGPTLRRNAREATVWRFRAPRPDRFPQEGVPVLSRRPDRSLRAPAGPAPRRCRVG
jgi:hypothetical protein